MTDAERMRAEARTVRSAWSVLAAGSVPAAQSLVGLATGARSEMVRAQAAIAVLDRVGLGRVEGVVVADMGRELDPEGLPSGGESAAMVLAGRMRALGAGVGSGSVSGDGSASVIRGTLAEPDGRQTHEEGPRGAASGQGLLWDSDDDIDAREGSCACGGDGCRWCGGPWP